MVDKSLQVDPAELRRAANELHTHHGDLRHEVHQLNTSHDDLQDTWAGASSDAVANVWKDLHPRITAHLDRLTDHADTLTDSARAYTAQDGDTADAVNVYHLNI